MMMICILQLKGITRATHAMSYGNVLYKDMERYASKVTGYPGVTNGTLTPAGRYVDDKTVPECTRYTMPQHVMEHEVGATSTQLDVMAKAKAEQAKKRARLL
jgi:hypothetical protein